MNKYIIYIDGEVTVEAESATLARINVDDELSVLGSKYHLRADDVYRKDGVEEEEEEF